MRALFLFIISFSIGLHARYNDHVGGSGTITEKGNIIIAGDVLFSSRDEYLQLNDKYGIVGKSIIANIEEKFSGWQITNQSDASTTVTSAKLKNAESAKAIVLAYGLSDLLSGTNPSDFNKAYEKLIATAKSTSAKVYICNLSPVQMWCEKYDKISSHYPKYQKIIKSLAVKNKITMIDLFEVNAENPKYFVDGITPVLYGAKFIADRMHQVLTGEVNTEMSMIFTDNMVMQRGEEIPVFGRTRPQSAVVVTFDKKEKLKTTADSHGFWMVKLSSKKADNKGKTLTIKTDDKSFTYKNILIGDVWLATGQSNMASVPVKKCVTAKEESENFPSKGYKNIRILQLTSPSGAAKKTYNWSDKIGVEKMPYFNYYTPVRGGWYEASNYKTISGMSGVAWFFAKQVHLDHKVPVGIVQSCIGGTSIESYIPHKAFFNEEEIISQVGIKDEKRGGMQSWVNDPKGANWAQEVAALQRSGLNRDDIPLAYHPMEHSFLYRSGIQPFIPYAIKGAIWYQGESNANIGLRTSNPTPTPLARNMAQYRALVSGWRQAWQDASGEKNDFAFLAVQLPVIGSRPSWPWYRDAQFRFWQDDSDGIDNVGVAITLEFGASNSNVHPYEKAAVSKRLARLAHRYAYKDMEYFYSGPVATSADFKGKKVEISFRSDTLGNGLQSYKKGSGIKYFELAAKDGKYHLADAVIKGKKVTITSSAVAKPVAVRYCWDKNPLGKDIKKGALNMLAASDGKTVLPASPFRFGEENFSGNKGAKTSSGSLQKVLNAKVIKADKKAVCIKLTMTKGKSIKLSGIGLSVADKAKAKFAKIVKKLSVLSGTTRSLKKAKIVKDSSADLSDVALYGGFSFEMAGASLKEGDNYIWIKAQSKVSLNKVLKVDSLSFSADGANVPDYKLK